MKRAKTPRASRPPPRRPIRIIVRPYSDKDWESVCDIHDRARPLEVGSVVPEDEIQPLAETAEADRFFDGQQYVACIGDRVVGFICIDGDELTWLYVDPDHHRQGIGRALVDAVRPQLGPDGFVVAVIENQGGVQFYQRMGFEIRAVFPGSCQGYPCTCVRLTLPGSRHANRPPRPVPASLFLAGYEEDDWGRAYRDSDGVWRWRRSPG